jgi:uncharacterized damage-inducible protein DinB
MNMNAQDAKLVSDFLLATLESEIPTTANVFRAVPSDRLDYRPDPLSKTALALMRHIALEDEWFLKAVADGAFAALPDDSDACALMTPADAVTFYNDRIPAAIGRIRTLSGEALMREVDLFGMMKMPALQFLSMALRHSTHHRGQLTAYLRAMGGKVPSVYGPSADTQMMAAKA